MGEMESEGVWMAEVKPPPPLEEDESRRECVRRENALRAWCGLTSLPCIRSRHRSTVAVAVEDEETCERTGILSLRALVLDPLLLLLLVLLTLLLLFLLLPGCC